MRRPGNRWWRAPASSRSRSSPVSPPIRSPARGRPPGWRGRKPAPWTRDCSRERTHTSRFSVLLFRPAEDLAQLLDAAAAVGQQREFALGKHLRDFVHVGEQVEGAQLVGGHHAHLVHAAVTANAAQEAGMVLFAW